jgi:hypothetical protein
MSIPVCQEFVCEVIAPLATINDVEAMDVLKIDFENETSVKKALTRLGLKSNFIEFDFDSQCKIKDSLKYAIYQGNMFCDDVFDSMSIDYFKKPTNTKDLFIWIWQVLFGAENYKIEDIKQYYLSEDFNFISSIKKLKN